MGRLSLIVMILSRLHWLNCKLMIMDFCQNGVLDDIK